MKKKIIGIIICMMMCTTITSTTGMHNTNKSNDNLPLMINDALIPSYLPELLNIPSSVPDPGFYETSEYMIGSVAVGVIFLESNGMGTDPNFENWNPTEETNVQNEIMAALSWWSGQNFNAGISFSYDWQLSVPTIYEPIIHPSVFTDPSWEARWVEDAMANLGYSSGDLFARTWSYINNLRTSKGTDWAFAVFVVDSSSDPDGYFSDAALPAFRPCAWGYTGGPFLVMTYDNGKLGSGGWGINRMDQVMAHETGHIFYAQDEYDGPTTFSGYLNAAEIEYSGALMDTASLSLSSGTRLQVGWRDTDIDNIEDIVDTNPDTTLNPYSPDPTTQTTLIYTGSSTVVPYPNNNPFGTGNSVTINTISNVEYRVNGGSWLGAVASDGLFDEPIESYTMTIGPLSPGTYTIDSRAMNSVSNYDLTPSSDTVTVTASSNNPPNTPSNPNPNDGTTNVNINADLSWTGGDPDVSDTVTYDVYFGTSSPPPSVTTGQSGTTYDPGTMSAGTKYYWQIVSWDNNGASTSGSIWDFTTVGGGNSAPNTPSKPSGPTTGNIGTQYQYFSSTTDSNGDNIKYGWDAQGDGIVDFWTSFLPSGTTSQVGITFQGAGTYNIQVMAEDTYGAQSIFSPQLTVIISGSNNNPYTPSNPNPSNHATGISITADLSWTGGDPDVSDTVTYDVYFGTSSPPTSVTTGQSGATYDPGTMSADTKYYWQIVSWDNNGASTSGPIWDFTTAGGSNNPPNKPNKPSGSTSGKAGEEYTYTTSTTDPEDDQIYYQWDWGDEISQWYGPYDSGETVDASHIWDEKGDYSIKVKTKDVHDEESPWSDPLSISMPKNKSYVDQLIQLLLQRNSQLFSIIRQIFRLL